MDEDKLEPLEDLLDEMREIEGFPKGEDEDILELSDPPYYTACPNPYLDDFIGEYGTEYDPESDDYERKPFVGDIKESKRDSISLAHKYVTKVPYKAIMYFIMHYTKPGDIVFDGFAGSGMTGIAAQMCENPSEEMQKKIEDRLDSVEYGARKAVLNELSPAASFITSNYNFACNEEELKQKAEEIIAKVEEECGWVYETNHVKEATDTRTGKQATLFDIEKNKGKINHIIWSDMFICPYCESEFVLWEEAIDHEKGEMQDEFKCSSCNAEITKKECDKAKEEYYDNLIGEKSIRVKKSPVLIDYSVGSKRFEKKPDKDDLELIKKIDDITIPYFTPNYRMPEGKESRRNDKFGMTHIHHFYTKRNLYVLAKFYNEIKKIDNKRIKDKLMFIFTSLLLRSSKKCIVHVSNFFHGGGGYVTTISGNLYIPSFRVETSVIENFKRRVNKTNKLNKYKQLKKDNARVNLGSATDLSMIPENSFDYMYIDPPFGSNLMYSELNFLTDSWLQVIENNNSEAIINSVQNKDLVDYNNLMEQSFKEFYRILKPNRWITIEFNNSKATIWNKIQESLTRAGFIIAQVAVLDKDSGSFVSNVSPGAVKNDLIINAYKPKKEFEDKFLKTAGEGLEADFIRQQLEHLPVEANIERTEQMLYSKMLAHYVENGFKIQYNANNFYQLLHDSFIERDGYWFLEEQADEYDRWKASLKLDEIEDIKEGNQVMFVTDEKSALTWLHNFLDEPKEYSEIYTGYEQVVTKTKDLIPELRDMLDNNFVMEDGKYRRPQTKEERQKIEENRERELERAWKDLLDKAKNGRRKIKNVRKEALIHGFTKCYQKENYEDIITVADRLYKSTLRSSGDILDFVDIARMKLDQ
ncbi:DNA methyltransferase [Acetohalobium arabaticum]|uniref:DNA methylase N-4/N-6 domain protein n=1 Tax=Acetohalobium arabaticum (strain ATCC 49924 / DSM 5501 / Z-7288) TaxID=574087 RepID=D9QQV7_ACEAZ|nr:DNA methyltransferase [Acetohalobium arabaticum]ADL12898.1 DNA methylase N-4/N-6 domain protein [Acetohalobium arabaticum DSM 5501]